MPTIANNHTHYHLRLSDEIILQTQKLTVSFSRRFERYYQMGDIWAVRDKYRAQT